MKHRLILLFIFAANLCLAQNSATKEINNTITKEHVAIDGIKLSLIPPNGFIVATNFDGFQMEETSSSILIVEIPAAYSVIAPGLTSEGLKTQGVIEETRENVVVNGYQGLYITASQVAYEMEFSKFMLVLGDENSTFMINGMYPLVYEKELKEEVEKCLLSVVYEKDKVIDPENSVNFSIQTEGTKLEFATMVSNSLIYSVGGQFASEAEDKTSFIIGNSISNVEIEDKKEFAIQRIKLMPTYDDLDIQKTKEVTLDGLSGYEIIAIENNENSDPPELVYQVILYDEDTYYLLVGMATDDFDANEKLFRKLSKTFERKR